jgi:ATP phosphoribosyltransferase regulatory subunit HisZ
MSSSDYFPVTLAREDVHKSCRSLEAVVDLLNGYCEAAGVVAQLQKKLVRAIRDTASMKASPAVASNNFSSQLLRKLTITQIDNTLNIAAAIFEITSEVNGKFVKIVDKECDGVNEDVKKWFRKLSVSLIRSFSALSS